MDRLINENAVLSAIGEWIAHNEHTYTNATEYLRNRIKAIKTTEQEPCEDCISREYILSKAHCCCDDLADDEPCCVDVDDIKNAPSVQPKPIECEDCISRAELLKAVDTWDRFGCDADSKLVPYKDCYVPYIHYDDVVKAIKGMPSIQPKPKTGHWKKTGFIDKVICDVCNKRVWDTFTDGVLNFQYCPNCGAKMIPTDSNCDSCEYQNEVDGSNCYECVKGIRNNYKADSEKE